MGMGRREVERQGTFWVATADTPQGPRHVFYEKLNTILAEAGFDAWIEELCEPFYAQTGRRGIPPGVFFRMLYIGYFEGIDSQRGIAWRCEDSLSLKRFLGYEPFDETPDHSSLSRIRCRLPWEVFEAVHRFVLEVLHEHNLLGRHERRCGLDRVGSQRGRCRACRRARRTKSIVRKGRSLAKTAARTGRRTSLVWPKRTAWRSSRRPT